MGFEERIENEGPPCLCFPLSVEKSLRAKSAWERLLFKSMHVFKKKNGEKKHTFLPLKREDGRGGGGWGEIKNALSVIEVSGAQSFSLLPQGHYSIRGDVTRQTTPDT